MAIAVNVSAIELRSKDFLEHATKVLRETGLDPRYLELELTESILMRHVPSSRGDAAGAEGARRHDRDR